jgi:hypothetical protein
MNSDLDLSESDKEIAASGLAEFLAESFTLYPHPRTSFHTPIPMKLTSNK